MSRRAPNRVLDFRKLMLIDLEATCWGPGKTAPHGEVSDIIEIGWARLDIESNHIEDHGTFLVRPQRSTVSKFCTELTSITKDMLFSNGGLSLRDAGAYFRNELKADHYPWGSWGMYDYNMMADSCQDLKVKFFLGRQHLNIKAMYAMLESHESGPGMSRALDETGLGFEGTQHRGGDDAWNLARIVQLMKSKYDLQP